MAEALTLSPFRPDPPSPTAQVRDRSPSPVPSASAPSRMSYGDDRLQKPRPQFRTISGSWGVSGIGRGFDWRWDQDREDDAAVAEDELSPKRRQSPPLASTPPLPSPPSDAVPSAPPSDIPDGLSDGRRSFEDAPPSSLSATSASPPPSPGPRPTRRRPSRRISLIAGRHVAPPTDLVPDDLPPVSPRITLSRANSSNSLFFTPISRRNSDVQSPPMSSPPEDTRTPLEAQEITYPPTYSPSYSYHKQPSFARASSVSSIFSAKSAVAPAVASEYDDDVYDEGGLAGFGVESEAGRGAYGLVKKARRVDAHGLPYGPPLIIKYVIKSRILADSWKRHRQYGTIPIEIHVLLFLSSVPHLSLPRPWHPARSTFPPDLVREPVQQRGHDNIGKLIEFWEDAHYYYLVMPFEEPGGDLFDLVEANPQGLAPYDVRSLFGQVADAVEFLHSKGIVHRDLKDENVVLGEAGRCYLIDFGSCASGWREGRYWDTFSGTLDYAGPEILRGERYTGKPQDVYALGVIGYVLLVGECPYSTATEAQAGLAPGTKAARALEARCGSGFEDGPSDLVGEREGEEKDGGGALEDAADLVRRCLETDVDDRPNAARVLEHRFLAGRDGWVGKEGIS